MIKLTILIIALAIYLAIAVSLKLSLSSSEIPSWWKKVLFHLSVLPATVCDWISRVLSIRIKSQSVFERLIAWFKR